MLARRANADEGCFGLSVDIHAMIARPVCSGAKHLSRRACKRSGAMYRDDFVAAQIGVSIVSTQTRPIWATKFINFLSCIVKRGTAHPPMIRAAKYAGSCQMKKSPESIHHTVFKGLKRCIRQIAAHTATCTTKGFVKGPNLKLPSGFAATIAARQSR